MILAIAGLVIAAAAAVTTALMFLLRQFVPPGGIAASAAGNTAAYSVLGTSVAVLTAFVLFTSVQGYRAASDSAREEAVATTQMYRTTVLMPPAVADPLRGELACYGRSVVDDEWTAMNHDDVSLQVQGWLDRMEATLATFNPTDNRGLAAEGQWSASDSERRQGRRERLSEAHSALPPLLWLALTLGALCVLAYALVFADPRARRWAQVALIAPITVVLTSALIVILFLNRPYEGSNGIAPTEMRRTLSLMQVDTSVVGSLPAIPCDGRGVPTRG
jgi:hypothetical protein